MTTENFGQEPTPTAAESARDRAFKIIIDKMQYETRIPSPTGRELLVIAGRVPVEQFGIYLRKKGAQPQRIQLDEHVDLTEPGVERFVTLPLDQTEG
jgi:hypothetical protein